MRSAAVGALVGLVGGSGLVLAISRLPVLRRPRLAERVAPYLTDGTRSRLVDNAATVSPFPTLERLLRPSVQAGARAIERALGGTRSVRRRLIHAGSDLTVEQFRIEQLLWGGIGLLGGLTMSLTVLASGRAGEPVALAVLCLFTAFAGVLLRDWALTLAVRRRRERLLWEFPTIAELFALSVAAGEGTVGALERLSRIGSGELVRELRATLHDVRAGSPVAQALDGFALRTALPVITRFVDGVLVAMDRGTPLADVVRAQAADVREAHKRTLIEAGGRREIAMIVPVVFLVLPVTVIFALFPGFYGLTFVSP